MPLCCAVELSWVLEHGKTLKLPWVTASCCSVDQEAGVAVWAVGQAVPYTGVVSRDDCLLEDSCLLLLILSLGFSHCLRKAHRPVRLYSSP